MKSPSIPLYERGKIEGKIYKRGNRKGIYKRGTIGGFGRG